MLSFKPAFPLFSFTFIKRLFKTFLFYAIRVVSSAYLSLLIFLPPILIPAYDSSSLAFHMIYSACKLIKQGDNIQSCCTPFPVLNQSVQFSSVTQSCPTLWDPMDYSMPGFHFHHQLPEPTQTHLH